MYRRWGLLLPCWLYLVTPAWGTVKGKVVTTTGNPLPYVYITDPGGQSWTLTNEYGEFQLPTNWPRGDSLTFSRYGYQSQTLPISRDQPWTVQLSSHPIALEPIEVTALPAGFTLYRFTHSKSVLDDAVSHGQFRTLPGGLLHSYGGLAGNASIALDGGSANQTKVVLEGIDLTNPQNGETDLSQFPGTIVNQLALAPLPGVLYGSGAVDGVIQLSSQEEPTHFRYARGSWGRQQWVANGHLTRKKWRGNFQGGLEKYQGNYAYQWRGIEKRRNNNQSEQRFGAYKLHFRPTPRQLMTAFFIHSRQDRGISGPVQAASDSARRQDRLTAGSIKFSYLSPKGYQQIILTGRWSTENYQQPEYHIDSDHNSRAETIRYCLENRVRPTLTTLLLGEWKRESIRSTDVGKHQRTALAVVSGMNYAPKSWLTVNPTLRWERARQLYQTLTYHLRLGIKPAPKINLDLNSGTSFRYPTFNDLYWRPGGNPTLNPEETDLLSLDLQRTFNDGSFALTLTNKNSTNLIRWVPDSTGWWSAQNYTRTRRFSGTFKVDYTQDLYYAYGSITFLKANDLTTNKPLRYTPRFLITGGLELRTDLFTVNLQVKTVSQRIALYDYPQNITLQPYTLVATGVSYTPPWSQGLTIILAVDNLLNQTYLSTYGYPEPGRALLFTFVYVP